MIQTRIDQKRGCGWRKPGGLYLVSGKGSFNCGKLPIALTVCPTCKCGIKPARGWTWVGKELVINEPCIHSGEKCPDCAPFNGGVDKMGLIWVGGKFYGTPGEFIREANAQGISRRISAVPIDFKVGETWILLAHRSPEPHIFMAFKPDAIEYVVHNDDPDDKIESLIKRGITPVKVFEHSLFAEDNARRYLEERGNYV